jgi:hypothetical protein
MNAVDLIVSDVIVGLQSHNNITDFRSTRLELAKKNRQIKNCFRFVGLEITRGPQKNECDLNNQSLINMPREHGSLLEPADPQKMRRQNAHLPSQASKYTRNNPSTVQPESKLLMRPKLTLRRMLISHVIQVNSNLTVAEE